MRRDFELGPDDTRALDALGCRWEAANLAGALWIIIHDFPIPAGYNVVLARVAIRVDNYPSGGIDMAYFYPPLSRSDGLQINNLTDFQLEGLTYQQWSRHYGWNPEVDSLATHIRRVRGWLKHEFRKR